MSKELPPLQAHRDDAPRLGSSQRFYRKVGAGELTCVHYGSYVSSSEELSRLQRHELKVQALSRRGLTNFALIGRSAATYWEMWLEFTPTIVEVLRTRTGQRSGKGYKRLVTFLADPRLVRRPDGIKVLARTDTVVSLSVQLSRSWAVAAMDWLLRQMVFEDRISEEEARTQITETIRRLNAKTKRQLATAILELATPLSMSPGETLSRIIAIDAGLEVPELQVRFEDERGFVAYVDAFFRKSRVIGEFDGMVKYRDAKFRNGKSLEEVLLAEKKREDRLRRLGYTVVRWGWDEIREPGRLVQLLRGAGVQWAEAQ